ncbi:MAG TPA: 6-phosphogluconolactonase [Chitinophagaceae bacterium]|nr:6-phosphogluconolactonase [Chitinophagaceae bacterium]
MNGEFNIALSGGSSPKKLYETLALPDYKNRVAWSKVNFFFGDERYVPAHDPQSNGNMVRAALFDPLHIEESTIFFVDTSLSPAEAARDYAARIANHFKGKESIFDLILLGLGNNSHTASLFPHTAVLHDQSASVKSVFVKDQNVYRITMTAPLINKARHIAFMVYGRSKAEAVHHVLDDAFDPEQYPAQLIKPENGNLHWYLDEEAASLLKG